MAESWRETSMINRLIPLAVEVVRRQFYRSNFFFFFFLPSSRMFLDECWGWEEERISERTRRLYEKELRSLCNRGEPTRCRPGPATSLYSSNVPNIISGLPASRNRTTETPSTVARASVSNESYTHSQKPNALVSSSRSGFLVPLNTLYRQRRSVRTASFRRLINKHAMQWIYGK